MELEGPDEPISMSRAAELAGLQRDSLVMKIDEGKLTAEKIERKWVTTRRHLHECLMHRGAGMVKPLPAGYQAPV